MPIVDGHNITPDDALKAGRCPECGKLLAEVSAEFHVAEHWPMPIPRDARHLEAERRKALLTEALAKLQKGA